MEQSDIDMVLLTLGWLDYEHSLTEGFESLEQMETTGRISYYRLAQLIRHLGFTTLEQFNDASSKVSDDDKTDYKELFKNVRFEGE